MSETGRGYGHRGGKVKGLEFASMNQDVSRRAVFLKERATRLIRWCWAAVAVWRRRAKITKA
jgi:hypothetical protein